MKNILKKPQNSIENNVWSDIAFFDSIHSVVTSKKALLRIDDQTYAFLIHPKLSKLSVKHAIGKYFSVRILKVNSLNLPPRKKRVGKFQGICPLYKKAIITLNFDDKINLFSDI
jgi:large subunit ribosomal protein L23